MRRMGRPGLGDGGAGVRPRPIRVRVRSAERRARKKPTPAHAVGPSLRHTPRRRARAIDVGGPLLLGTGRGP